jgi:hypothetical protein
VTSVRTTVNIDDELLVRARELATRTRRSLGDIVDDALRVLMAQRQGTTAPAPVTLPTDGGSGLQPGVDLEDKEALAALLDDERSGAPR